VIRAVSTYDNASNLEAKEEMLAAVLSQFEVVQPVVHCGPPSAPKGFTKFQPNIQVFVDGVQGALTTSFCWRPGVGAGRLVELKLRFLDGREVADSRASRVGANRFHRPEARFVRP